jgi:hypothetical protein
MGRGLRIVSRSGMMSSVRWQELVRRLLCPINCTRAPKWTFLENPSLHLHYKVVSKMTKEVWTREGITINVKYRRRKSAASRSLEVNSSIWEIECR